MAFTVGTNSYASVADADTYHADRGNSLWADQQTASKEAALIKATDYIDQEYGSRFIGYQVSDTQPLEWPRSDISNIAENEIPISLKQATYQLALESLEGDLNPILPRGGEIKREKVDVLETEYMENAPIMSKRPAIDGLLRKIIRGSNAINAKVVRV